MAKFMRDVCEAVVRQGVTKSTYDAETGKNTQEAMSKEEVEAVLRASFKTIGDMLSEGDKVYLIGFMNLETHDFAAKDSVHPQTNVPMSIQGYRGVFAKPSEQLKIKLAEGYARDHE